MRQGKKTASYECVVCAIKSFVDKILMATAFSLSSSRFIYLSLVAVAFDATKRSAWPAYCAHFLLNVFVSISILVRYVGGKILN